MYLIVRIITFFYILDSFNSLDINLFINKVFKMFIFTLFKYFYFNLSILFYWDNIENSV